MSKITLLFEVTVIMLTPLSCGANPTVPLIRPDSIRNSSLGLVPTPSRGLVRKETLTLPLSVSGDSKVPVLLNTLVIVSGRGATAQCLVLTPEALSKLLSSAPTWSAVRRTALTVAVTCCEARRLLESKVPRTTL